MMPKPLIAFWIGVFLGYVIALVVAWEADSLLPNGVSVEQLIERGVLAYCQSDGKLTYVGECE